MTETIVKFNLVEDPWLPVTTLAGETEEWGLRDLFHRAHEAQALNESSPLAYTAILRFLLAVAHRSLHGPGTDDAWFALWQQRSVGFDRTQFDAYLDRWCHRFNLFDAEAPFGQVTDFDPKDEGSPLSRLVLEQTSGSNSTLFDHSRDDTTPSVPAASAARSLLAAHQYAFAGTAGRYMQAPMVAGYSVSWQGNSLYETLVLNMVVYSDSRPPMLGSSKDFPFWESDNLAIPNKETRVTRGLTDLYTFRARRLQLIPESDGSVRRVRYDQGLVLDLMGETLRDPFKRYLAQKQANAQLPRNFSENRALWRDADGLIEHSDAIGVENQPPRVISDLRERIHSFGSDLKGVTPSVIATGLVNNQARISLWRMDRMALPLSILGDEDLRADLHKAIENAESAWSNALRPAARTFASIGHAGTTQGVDSNDIAAVISRLAIEQRYWSQVDRAFQAFLTDLGQADESDDALYTWNNQLQVLCKSCFRDATMTMQGKRWYQAQSVGGSVLMAQLRKIGLIEEQKEEQDDKNATVAGV